MHGSHDDVHGLMSLMHYEFAASMAQPYNDVHGLYNALWHHSIYGQTIVTCMSSQHHDPP